MSPVYVLVYELWELKNHAKIFITDLFNIDFHNTVKHFLFAKTLFSLKFARA